MGGGGKKGGGGGFLNYFLTNFVRTVEIQSIFCLNVINETVSYSLVGWLIVFEGEEGRRRGKEGKKGDGGKEGRWRERREMKRR